MKSRRLALYSYIRSFCQAPWNDRFRVLWKRLSRNNPLRGEAGKDLNSTKLGPVKYKQNGYFNYGWMVEIVATAPGGSSNWDLSQQFYSIAAHVYADGRTVPLPEETMPETETLNPGKPPQYYGWSTSSGNTIYAIDAPGVIDVSDDRLVGQWFRANFTTTIRGRGDYAHCSKSITWSTATEMYGGRVINTQFFPHHYPQ